MIDPDIDRWVLVAASGRAAAAAYARRQGLEPVQVLVKQDLLSRRLRQRVRDAGAGGVIVHSTSWQRQPNPQIYELALAIMPVRGRYIVDEERDVTARIGAADMISRAARVPVDVVRSSIMVGREAVRASRGRRVAEPPDEPTSVLAIWPGSPEAAGGSLTHITGILGAFRRRGIRIGVLTCQPPPDRLCEVADDLEVVSPLPAAARLTRDIEQIAANDAVRRAGAELARRVRPAFVYQRHSPFLVAGADLASTLELPLVLEWNGSEAWIRDNWQVQLGVERILDPVLARMERRVVRAASLVTCVSSEAAAMAFRAGADESRTVVVPNAVDVDEVDALVGDAVEIDPASGALLGWAGTFGPWHGAPVAVHALAALPEDVRLVMIGDGSERAACERLADSLGIAHRIEITGLLPRRLTLRRLAACDVLLSPHTPLPNQPFFGSPTKLFEYMALGKPIVASNLGQLGEVLADGVTARLVTPGRADELAEAVLEVLSSPDRGLGLGSAARREAEAAHTWDQRARSLLGRLGRSAPEQLGAERVA